MLRWRRRGCRLMPIRRVSILRGLDGIGVGGREGGNWWEESLLVS